MTPSILSAPPTKPSRRDERGTVLIFVVGVLVLLALAATAYLSTARIDRTTTKQNEFNTQVDLLLEACRDMAKAALIEDDSVSAKALEFSPNPADSMWGDTWMASRVPTNFNPVAIWDGNTNPGMWSTITGPLIGNQFQTPTGQIVTGRSNVVPHGTPSGGRMQPTFSYDTNAGTLGFQPALGTNLSVSGGGNMLFAGDADGDGVADSLPIKLPVGKINGIDYYAYFRIIDNGSAVNATTAMSRWFDWDFAGATLTAANHGFFLTNIGLLELFSTYSAGANLGLMGTEFGSLNAWKGNTATDPAPIATFEGVPRADNNTPRTEMVWLTLGDSMHHQLSLRPDNPGPARDGARYRAFDVTDATSLASRFVLTDSLGYRSPLELALKESLTDNTPSVAYAADQANAATGWYFNFFDMGDPSGTVAALFKPRRALITTASQFRQLVPTAYATPITALWPHADMRWDDLNSPGNVADGTAVAKVAINTAPFSELFRGFWQVFAEPDASALANSGAIFLKANIDAFYSNAAYHPYQGMTWDSSTSAATGTLTDSHPAAMFRSPIRATSIADAASPTIPSYANTPIMPADQVMLLRAGLAATNLQTARLANHPVEREPAVAGDLQSPPDIAVENTIALNVNVGGSAIRVQVRMYGVQRQPYISEVFAQNDTVIAGPLPNSGGGRNIRGYVAIEFYNPHDIPIDLTNCKIGLLRRHGDTDRRNTPTLPYMQFEDATTIADPIDFAAVGGFASNLDDPTMYESAAGVPAMIVPAKGYLVLENFQASGTDPHVAKYRPASSIGPGNGWDTTSNVATIRAPGLPDFNVVYVRNLDAVFNREFVLMRPKSAIITDRSVLRGLSRVDGVKTLVYVNPAAGLTGRFREDYVPLDSYDLSGLMIDRAPEAEWTDQGTGLATAWHYQRSTNPWQCVYPGRYDGSKSEQTAPGLPLPRTQGTAYAPPWAPDGTQQDTWDPNRLPAATPAASPLPAASAPTFTLANPLPRQDKVFTIQLLARDWPGINYLRATGNMFPFGKFARAGDLMQVPFIGTYLMWPIAATDPTLVLEVNPITLDSAMAEDTDPNDDGPATGPQQSFEQIGRFCPLNSMQAGGVAAIDPNAGGTIYSDYADDTSREKWRYRFARKLFDYFSIYAPSNDYQPDIRRDIYGYYVWNDASKVGDQVALPAPTPVDNAGAGATGTTDRTDLILTNDNLENLGVLHGQININTASYKVLSMVPWIPNIPFTNNTRLLWWDTTVTPPVLRPWITGNPEVNDNEDLARAIVYWRDGDPSIAGTIANSNALNSIYDLYKIPAFRVAQTALVSVDWNGNSVPDEEPDDITGDLSPYDATRNNTTVAPIDPTGDGVRYDFEEQYLLLNRVSNLITTRSDTYTVYILLQGYRNAGTANPELVVERRAAMIVDRSRYTTTNGNVTATKVPTN